jgi:hypothetical protein
MRKVAIPKSKLARRKKDRRRKHDHWLVTLTYFDGETFERVYIDHEKAANFAARQKKSPVVKKTRVRQLS